MEYIDFNDEKIPIGKRKMAYVKWAMSKGTTEKKARMQANKKFGFERKGKVLVYMHDADCMDCASMRSVPWDRACGIDARKLESAIVVPDSVYASFEMCEGMFSAKSILGSFPKTGDYDGAKIWAKRNGYFFKEVRITP